MLALVCSLLSAVGFYFSINLGEIWPLAWLAPIPVLWLAFGEARAWSVFFSAWAAYAIGSINLLWAYWGTLPLPILVIALTIPSLGFAGSVIGARRVARSLGPIAGVLAFAAIWTMWDYVISFGPDGAATSPSYSQVGAPYLIQGASVFGLWIVTFLLGLVPAGLAMALRARRILPAVVVVAAFGANLGFGAWTISQATSEPTTRVALGADDSHGNASFAADSASALTAIDAYGAAARNLASRGVTLIVFPEKLAILMPPWRDDAIRRMQAISDNAHATIVMGFDDRGDSRLNEALVFTPGGPAPRVYLKRHFVGGLEDAFHPGDSPFALPDHTGVAICKDMDFPAMLRHDVQAEHPTLLAVPAWDFDSDRYGHARMAIMRGVEGGFAVARAAKHGLLTLSDAYGRVLATKPSQPNGMVTVVAELARGPGDTLFAGIGDVFAWFCTALAMFLILASFWRRNPT